MTVFHFATELSGGAGGFVRNLHEAMHGMGLQSLVLTRDRASLDGVITLMPSTRVANSLRARIWTLLGKVGLVQNAYALFGVERSPVTVEHIQAAIGAESPSAFFFYWISRFVDFDTMLQLRRAYPEVPIVLVCTDEAFLTGGCHYSNGCAGYQRTCGDCPATRIAPLQRQIEQSFVQRGVLLAEIDPIVIYPTTKIRDMGERSSVMKRARSWVLPLGVFSRREQALATQRREERLRSRQSGDKVTLLVRSSTEYRKGCDLFVSALDLLGRSVPDLLARVRVVSIGDDALMHMGISRHVEHVPLGIVNREDLISAYCVADALVCPSREDGGPLMTNESVALGLYVISTPVGVAGDLIVSPEVGRITRDITAEAIGEALRDYLAHYAPPAGRDTPHASFLTFESYITSLTGVIPSVKAAKVIGLSNGLAHQDARSSRAHVGDVC